MKTNLMNSYMSKYNTINLVRTKVMQLKNVIQVNDVTSSATGTVTNDTAELIKSFKASLTLPRPEFQRFNGKANKFAEFLSYIETYVERNVDDPKQRLTLLIDTCGGLARESIAYLLQSSDASAAYEQAKKTLTELFGRKHQIVRAVMDECTNGNAIKAHDFDQLKRLVISMKKAIVTLEECGAADELKGFDRLIKVYQRLPSPIQNRWNDRLMDLQERR